MSRIGKNPIVISNKIFLSLKNNILFVKGPLGNLSKNIPDNISIKIENNFLYVIVSSENNNKRNKSFHGLYRSLIYNMFIGVLYGFKKKLELVGVGYRAVNKGQILELNLGYSHNIVLKLPKEINVKIINLKANNPLIILKSHDKQLLGIIAAKIRSFRVPEPYKGKGIKYLDEFIRRKQGKSA